MMQVYEYVAWLRPTKKELKDDEDKEGEMLTKGVQCVLADDGDHAKLLALGTIALDRKQLRRVEVRVRPFCS